MIAPTHIMNYCKVIDPDSVFSKIKKKYGGNYSFVYQVSCSCGCNSFKLMMDSHPTANAVCVKCGALIVLYDLELYTNAMKLPSIYEMKKFTSPVSGTDVFEICVLYEYSDEFPFHHELFDVNDITAFALFTYDSNRNQVDMIMDDETA